MARVMVTGAGGLLGLSLCLDLATAHDVVGVTRTRTLVHPGVTGVTAELTDDRALSDLWAVHRPDLVVHAAALTSIEACEADPALARQINTELAARVARLCRQHGTRLVQVSTDAVFDGTAGPYREDDAVRPRSVYARTKADAELACLDALPSSLVARVNFFGWSATGRRSLAEFFYNELSAGTPVGGFVDVLFSPLYQRDLGELLMAAVAAGVTGIRHAGGPEALTKHDFGRRLAEVFGLDPELVHPTTVHALEAGAVRSPRLALDSSRLAGELGRPLPSVTDGLARMRQDLEAGRPALLGRTATDRSPRETREAEV